ncbi:hypothetical protein [Alicyclobacillus suci]|uniref:hypothetical protein n=1 Tax=Alicyclobacillus suci TaxID=2816080 RepID=UPI001A8F0A97|nr:hypothetical protein [Alicyclobacillus suci]
MAVITVLTSRSRNVSLKTSWVSQAAFLAVLAFFFIEFYSTPFSTGDTMWSNWVGQWIALHRSVPMHVYGTWTAVGQRWMPQEWGFELLLYTVSHYLGYRGVVAMMTLVSLLTWSIFYDVLRYSNVPYARVWAIIAGILSTPWDQIRAETFSYLFMVVTLWIVFRIKKWLLRIVALSLLQIIWVNMHGSFMLEWLFTLSIGLITLIPSVKTHWIQHERSVRQDFFRSLVTTGVLFSVSLINPQGFSIYRFALWLSAKSGVQNYIMEWQPATITEWITTSLSLIIAVMLVIRIQNKERLKLFQTIWAVIVFLMFLKSVRFGSYALILTVWAFAPRTKYIPKSLYARFKRLRFPRELYTALRLGLFIGLSLLIVEGISSVHGSLYANANASVEPHAVVVVKQIEQKHPTWRVWNDYNIGGTLETMGVPVSIDGRTEIYLKNGYMEKFSTILDAKKGAERYLNQEHVNVVCIQSKEALNELLSDLPDWKLVYSDQGYVVFERVGVGQ